ncbi:MAG: FHA domain-containing protein [Lachnospiraceae bacterium]|jgi:FOG: FHA domain
MYRIAILEKDEAYLERLIIFLKEHHEESFEIYTAKESADWDHLGFKDIEAEAVLFDALFLGDELAASGGFPQDMVTGYLTEKEEVSEQYISKYQSMEQIYRRMMQLCEASKASGQEKKLAVEEPPKEKEKRQLAAGYDLKPKTETVSGETYRVYHIAEDQVDKLAVRMMTGNRIKGLPEAVYQDGALKIHITDRKNLCAFVHQNNTPKGKERLLKLFSGMLTTALGLDEYMLCADRLLLDPMEIYLNAAEDRAVIPYIPIKNGERKDVKQCLVEIRDLCNALLQAMELESSDAIQTKKEDSVQPPKEDLVQVPVNASPEITKVVKNVVEQEKETKTEQLDRPQNNGIDSAKPSTENVPYLIRKRTREKIVINRSLFKLGKEAAYVDYCISDNPTVSRNHADIVRRQDGYYLVDKNSLNHSFVNGKKLAADEYRKLENGCLIQLADEVFEFFVKNGKKPAGKK